MADNIKLEALYQEIFPGAKIGQVTQDDMIKLVLHLYQCYKVANRLVSNNEITQEYAAQDFYSIKENVEEQLREVLTRKHILS